MLYTAETMEFVKCKEFASKIKFTLASSWTQAVCRGFSRYRKMCKNIENQTQTTIMTNLSLWKVVKPDSAQHLRVNQVVEQVTISRTSKILSSGCSDLYRLFGPTQEGLLLTESRRQPHMVIPDGVRWTVLSQPTLAEWPWSCLEDSGILWSLPTQAGWSITRCDVWGTYRSPQGIEAPCARGHD